MKLSSWSDSLPYSNVSVLEKVNIMSRNTVSFTAYRGSMTLPAHWFVSRETDLGVLDSRLWKKIGIVSASSFVIICYRSSRKLIKFLLNFPYIVILYYHGSFVKWRNQDGTILFSKFQISLASYSYPFFLLRLLITSL